MHCQGAQSPAISAPSWKKRGSISYPPGSGQVLSFLCLFNKCELSLPSLVSIFKVSKLGSEIQEHWFAILPQPDSNHISNMKSLQNSGASLRLIAGFILWLLAMPSSPAFFLHQVTFCDSLDELAHPGNLGHLLAATRICARKSTMMVRAGTSMWKSRNTDLQRFYYQPVHPMWSQADVSCNPYFKFPVPYFKISQGFFCTVFVSNPLWTFKYGIFLLTETSALCRMSTSLE